MLCKLRQELGLSGSAMARLSGISAGDYSALETMRYSPVDCHGDWSKIAIKIASCHGISPEEIWPLQHQRSRAVSHRLLRSHLASETVETPEECLLLEERDRVLHSSMGKLRSRRRDILVMRFFDEKTLEQCSAETIPQDSIPRCISEPHRVTRETARQIEAKALRDLRKILKRKADQGDI
jgi:DNA-directed RNA polymerase specialized sigma subunit